MQLPRARVRRSPPIPPPQAGPVDKALSGRFAPGAREGYLRTHPLTKHSFKLLDRGRVVAIDEEVLGSVARFDGHCNTHGSTLGRGAHDAARGAIALWIRRCPQFRDRTPHVGGAGVQAESNDETEGEPMTNVNVSYQDMQQQAAKLRAEQQETSARLQALQSEIQTLVTTGFVTDSASAQFAAAYESFNRGVQQALEGLDAMALYLDRAAAAFESVDADLARALA